jgi:hypothetical protein
MIDPFTQVMAVWTGPGYLAPTRGHPAATCCERTALLQVDDHKCPLLRVAQERLSVGMGYKLDDMKTHIIMMISSGDLYNYIIGYLMILIKCLALITYCPSNICII